MAQTIASFDAGHGGTVHDVQLDYYGRRLATASSDRSIKVFDVVGEQVPSAAWWRLTRPRMFGPALHCLACSAEVSAMASDVNM